MSARPGMHTPRNRLRPEQSGQSLTGVSLDVDDRDRHVQDQQRKVPDTKLGKRFRPAGKDAESAASIMGLSPGVKVLTPPRERCVNDNCPISCQGFQGVGRTTASSHLGGPRMKRLTGPPDQRPPPLGSGTTSVGIGPIHSRREIGPARALFVGKGHRPIQAVGPYEHVQERSPEIGEYRRGELKRRQARV